MGVDWTAPNFMLVNVDYVAAAAVPSASSHAVSARDLETFGGLVRDEMDKQWTVHSF